MSRLKSSNPKHLAKAKLLRQMRKDAGLTQREIAQRLFISRETVIAMENCYLGTMETMQSDLQEKWWDICRPRVTSSTYQAFRDFILQSFKL